MAYEHEYYNRGNFPYPVMNHGNWDIYSDGNGHCAAIPTPRKARDGCKATHFGTWRRMVHTLTEIRDGIRTINFTH